MSQVFSDFNDRIVVSGLQSLSPTINEELSFTAARLHDLVNSSASPRASEEEHESRQAVEESGSRIQLQREQGSTLYPSSNSNTTSQLPVQPAFHRQQSVSTDDPHRGAPLTSHLMLGYEVTYEDDAGSVEHDISSVAGLGTNQPYSPTFSSFPAGVGEGSMFQEQDEVKEINGVAPPSARKGQKFTAQDFSDWKFMEQFRLEFPEPMEKTHRLLSASNKSLTPPMTFSHQESSFARRLLRRAYEYGLKLMSTPGAESEMYRVCKFTFCWAKKEAVIQSLQKMVSTGSYDSLERWSAPQLHMGDAGLHYPRNAYDTNGPPPPWWEKRAPNGPWPLWNAETPKDPSLTIEQVIEQIGFGGDWFDSSDVEQYLRTKGIYLDGNSSVVAVKGIEDLPSMSSPTNSSVDTSGGPSSPQFDLPLFPEGHTIVEGSESFWNSTADTLATFDTALDLSFSDSTVDQKMKDVSFDMNKLPGFFNSVSGAYPVKKVIDVEKFIESKHSYSRCCER